MHALWWMCVVLTGQTAGVALLLRAAAPLAGLERSAAAAPAPSQASDLLTEQRRTQHRSYLTEILYGSIREEQLHL